jgi:PHD/YefM family antitoxin component YafN of YafNO toxin-antitoxin module
MTAETLARALKTKKPAVIREKGTPRFVVLDWETYKTWRETEEDLEDATRLMEALADPKNQKRTPLSRVKKIFHLP